MFNLITNALTAIPWNNTSYMGTRRKNSEEARGALKAIYSDSQQGYFKGVRQSNLEGQSYAAVGDESTSLGSKVYNFFFRSKEDAFKNRSALHQMAHDIEKACPGNSTLLNNFKKNYALHLLTASTVTPKEFTDFLNRNLVPNTTLDDFFSDEKASPTPLHSKGVFEIEQE